MIQKYFLDPADHFYEQILRVGYMQKQNNHIMMQWCLTVCANQLLFT